MKTIKTVNTRQATLLPKLASVALLVSCGHAAAADYFDPGLLSLNGADAVATDLSMFETSGQIPPGTYLVNLFVNQTDMGEYTLVFKADEKGNVQPELSPELLDKLGVNVKGLSAFTDLPTSQPVKDLSTLIPESASNFDFAQLRLDLSFPQIVMKPNAQGTVDPSLWDDGVPALLVNYNVNGGRNWQDRQVGIEKQTMTNMFASANVGVNVQAWRLRSDMSYMRNSISPNRMGTATGSMSDSQINNTYVQRDIRQLDSEILIGENNSGNDVFDSVPFRGVKLNSNEEMLPNSLRGFAPVVSGIAQTNARVTVSQNGNVVYQTFVAPGPFRIEDLFQSGLGGDLLVTITESDGTVRTQTVAFSSLPVMRRPGSFKYEVTAGQYNGGITNQSKEANFMLATATYGLPRDVTLYGGSLMAKDYYSLVLGTGVSLGSFGAISADITTSSTRLTEDADRVSGASYRVRYAKSLLDTGTSVDLTAYRYSTRNYHSFSDFNTQGFDLSNGQVPWAAESQRSNFQIRLSQQLGSLGSMYLSGSRYDYWTTDKVVNNLSAGFNSSFRRVTYSVAYSIDRMQGEQNWPVNRQFSFNMQVPMSLFTDSPMADRISASYQMTNSSNGSVQQSVGMNGNALDSRLSYSVMQGWANGQGDSTSTLNAGYQGSKGSMSMGYSYGSNNRSLNVGGNGGMVFHPEGITFAPMLGNSVAIVSAPGSDGASVMFGNVKTDSRGYAVVPYLSNYQNNSISVNPSTLPNDVDLSKSSINVYPTKGAVVMAKFATRIGYQVLITLKQVNNQPIPFGALVTVEGSAGNEVNSGIVGDVGQVYMSGLQEQGTLLVKWGKGSDQQCIAPFNMKDATAPSANNPIRNLIVDCNIK